MTEPPLERRLAEARAEAKALTAQNESLSRTLAEARSQLVSLKGTLDRLGNPPLTRGRLVGLAEDRRADVHVLGRHLRVAIGPDVDPATLVVGRQVLLNDDLVLAGVVDALDPAGELARVLEVHGQTAVVQAGQDELSVRLAPAAAGARAADTVQLDRGAGVAVSVVRRRRVEELVLSEVPDVSYDDIGGLAHQIDQIRDAVELPFRHRDRFQHYRLTPPKGVLLYGPPGCGKTMIAKAVARSLGESSIFISVKGPELLNKYVGESERQVRLIFERARQHAVTGVPVVVFFDEMDSLFRTRGSGVSSDVESTIVPQLLSEIDGVVGLDNVIVIGASNREDMIDPAILRAGRLDVKIRLDRPDADAAADILAKYLDDQVPLAGVGATELIDLVVSEVYSRGDQQRFAQIGFESGRTEDVYFADIASGAMLRNIVDRAKRIAIKDELEGGAGGLSPTGIRQAVAEELAETEGLHDSADPAQWARISGRRGERVAWMRSLRD